MWDIQPATPGFLIATLVAVVVTIITPKPTEVVVSLFDKVNSRSRHNSDAGMPASVPAEGWHVIWDAAFRIAVHLTKGDCVQC